MAVAVPGLTTEDTGVFLTFLDRLYRLTTLISSPEAESRAEEAVLGFGYSSFLAASIARQILMAFSSVKISLHVARSSIYHTPYHTHTHHITHIYTPYHTHTHHITHTHTHHITHTNTHTPYHTHIHTISHTHIIISHTHTYFGFRKRTLLNIICRGDESYCTWHFLYVFLACCVQIQQDHNA